MDCPFCHLDYREIQCNYEGRVIATPDLYPVSPGHTLIIPTRHVSSYFDLNMLEKELMQYALLNRKEELDATKQPDGYNIGINVGEAAGQTVMHVHMHLIPRYNGDVENPRGGIRHCIPGKGYYDPK